jgi:hypothetical protein
MPRFVYSAALSVIFAALVAGAFVWYNDRPSSYDECVVSEMRGQSAQIMYAVQKVCAVRFHKEDELPLSLLSGGKLDFMMLPDFDKDRVWCLWDAKISKSPPCWLRSLKTRQITKSRAPA